MASEITLRSCSSKWVNNQMEVNDWPMKKWRWWCKHDQGFNGWSTTFTMVIYQGIVHFLTSLNAGGNICSILCLFFNEHELCAKTARILRLFFNEHELCAKTARILRLFFNEHELCTKTARLTQSYDKSVSLRFYFLWSFISQSFAPHPFFMQVRKRLTQKTDK